MNEPPEQPAAWQESDSQDFARLGHVFTPGREEIEATLMDLVPARRDESFLAVDVGCGQGWLSKALLRKFPSSHVIALDGSPLMLAAAREALLPYEERVELRPFRLEDFSWVSALPVPVRYFMSCLVLHHLDGPGKRELFERLHAKLKPGGGLVFADVVEPQSEWERLHVAKAWNEEVRRRSIDLTQGLDAYQHFLDDRWNVYEHPDPIDKPSGVAEQLRWLEEAGFEGVGVYWARAGHAVLGGYKAGDAPATSLTEGR